MSNQKNIIEIIQKIKPHLNSVLTSATTVRECLYKNLYLLSNIFGVPENKVELTLKQYASVYASTIGAQVIAITGSCGKTTTKDMVLHVCKDTFNTVATPKNYNNAIGIAFTSLQLHENTELAIIEMGTNSPGDIKESVNVIKPHWSVITNIQNSHLEGLHDLDGVLNEKSNIIIDKPNHIAFINSDDSLLNKNINVDHAQLITFGVNSSNFKPSVLLWNNEQLPTFVINDTCFNLQLPGTHNLYNAIACIAICSKLDIPLPIISQRLSQFKPPHLRSEIIDTPYGKWIVDCYNANPFSVKQALLCFSKIQTKGKKIVILSDMLELGEKSVFFHIQILKQLSYLNIQTVITIGKNFAQAHSELKNIDYHLLRFNSIDNIANYISNYATKEDRVLVKGSRKFHLEQLTELLSSSEII
ncbi:UDP-N-acetylmuramoyl-tripeptide--D-alanyl-D-alanine ligase [Spartinivicinus poritis]|uniref:UDP-N-acetylmuramoyl-tripeptide--D-alanyl-D-alanine ligase n=1 Tax=Spartinivicinus poritis TaxID=2994640 RepID=A0ABT5UDH5_9GAMM|nr:UDP-N-acetylmuramoyl-tripeptide--D-alanyl-D-alanine ligase [Spartinivicinus sp. A2-2]MDE1464423.1 UDP-N-acetylmuramoyl-tripeptide--D-alanyl-D-alanine ligase [Spartinivicinus sp. A2-2]